MITVLIELLVLCAIVGIVYWLVMTVIPMPPPIRIVAQVVVAIFAIVLLLGLIGWMPGWRIGHLPR